MGDALFDFSQAADCLSLSQSSVYELVERRQIPAIRIGRLLRIGENEFDDTLRIRMASRTRSHFSRFN